MSDGRGGAREGAGRKEGIPNKLAREHKELIGEAGVLEFLIEAFAGKMIDGEILTLQERVEVAKFLCKKIVPDLKAIEHSGTSQGINLIVQEYRLPDDKNKTG